MALTRRALLGLGLVAAAGAGGLSYARFIEPRRLERTRKDVTLKAPSFAPFRVLHLSDLHWSRDVPLGLIEEAIALGLDARPDLVCLTGDYITTGDRRELDRYVPALAPLARGVPAFAVLGNNDGGRWSRGRGGHEGTHEIESTLRDAGIHVLINAAERVEPKAGARVTVVGLADLWAGGHDPAAAFKNLPPEPDGPVILLAHNPDAKDFTRDRPWHLMLSGHTHGGQVVLPLLGAPVAHIRDRRFVAGLVAWQGRLVYVTRGVGSIYGIRVNCRPEVSILDLRSA